MSVHSIRGAFEWSTSLDHLCRFQENIYHIQFMSSCVCRKLWLGNNLLEELPSSIGGCASLKHLFVEDNKLQRLPDTLAQLKLEKLNMRGNPLTSMPDWVLAVQCAEHPGAS